MNEGLQDDLNSIPQEGVLSIRSSQNGDRLRKMRIPAVATLICIFLGSITGSGLSQDVTGQQLQVRDTVLEFMWKHPERLQEPASHLIVAAMVGAFPCR